MDSKQPIPIPTSLLEQLRSYRQALRIRKLSEAFILCAAVFFSCLVAIFLLDRLFDTSVVLRLTLLGISLTGAASFAWACKRWLLDLSSLEAISKELRRHQPALGDSILGALELAGNDSAMTQSRVLCEAALRQVAESASKRHLQDYLPIARGKSLQRLTAGMALLTASLWVLFPAASLSSWKRFAFPLAALDRYAFTKLEPFNLDHVVPYGEDFPISFRLASDSSWRPDLGSIQKGGQFKLESVRNQDRFDFSVPPQFEAGSISLSVGDAFSKIRVKPSMRPELAQMLATIWLPEYLQIDAPIQVELRTGTLSVLEGSWVEIASTTSKPLASASANGVPLPVNRDGNSAAFGFSLKKFPATGPKDFLLDWQDEDGLPAKNGFPLRIETTSDEPPLVFAEGLPKSPVLLDAELLKFTVRAMDDFGVKQVGFEWALITDLESPPNRNDTNRNDTNSAPVGSHTDSPAKTGTSGQWILMSGAPTSKELEGLATFQASTMGVPNGPIELRLFVEDYHPDRGRIYSAPQTLQILSPGDHAEWIIEQMNKWQRESLEVRDRELQLLAANRQLRSLSSEESARDDVRKQIERQASAEHENGRRLSSLNERGDQLLRLAARNPDLDPNHLESWAQMQQVLRDIASNRMPSVVDLLRKSAAAHSSSTASSSSGSATTNEQSDATSLQSDALSQSQSDQSGSDPSASQSASPSTPDLQDRETSHQPADSAANAPSAPNSDSSDSTARISLPTTTLQGAPAEGASTSTPEETTSPADQTRLDQAISEQMALLDEFQKVADNLQQVMGNLEGSTLVKRLKAASRDQMQIAESTNEQLPDVFGTNEQRLTSEQRLALNEIKAREHSIADTVATIFDDMKGFQQRRPAAGFEAVLMESASENAIESLRQLSERLMHHQGIAIAEAEYWSDVFDRWAEDIVESNSEGGEGESAGEQGSIPPQVILEVMQILEQEVNLRDRTRVVEQSKPVATESEHSSRVRELINTQAELKTRIASTQKTLQSIPGSETAFQKELGMLSQVQDAMRDAISILSETDTGSRAIAAETEVIELLLETQRSSAQSASSGGGANAGGGGEGESDIPALALLGAGLNAQDQRAERSVSQETGRTQIGLPEEFRNGLDQYFERIDRSRK